MQGCHTSCGFVNVLAFEIGSIAKVPNDRAKGEQCTCERSAISYKENWKLSNKIIK